MAALGPHGLIHSGYGSFATKNQTEKVVGSGVSGRLGPHGLHLGDFSNVGSDGTASVTKADIRAVGGSVSALTTRGIVQLGPHGLVTKERAFAFKGVGHVSAGISGAQMVLSGEELEGVSTAIYLDGAEVNAQAGSVASVDGIAGMTEEDFRRHRKLQALRRHGTHHARPLKRR